MQHTKNNNPDAFSKTIKQKLENHQLPVDPNGWNAIEKQLNSKHSSFPKWLVLALSSAAVLALVFVLQIFNQQNENIADLKQATVNMKTEKVKQPNFVSIGKKSRIRKNSNAIVKYKKMLTNNESTVTKGDAKSLDVIVNDSLLTKNIISANVDTDTHLPVAHNNDVDTTSENKTIPKVYFDLNQDNILVELPQKKEINNWMLAASYGSQGNPQFSTNRELFATNIGEFALSNADAKYSSIMAPNDFSSKTYLDPVSVGITIRRKLNSTFSLESGLVYTYLLSVFENNGMQRSDGKLHLHYVGIPVNLVIKIWEKKNWELYSTLGVLSEKGLQKIYVQNLYNSNQTFTTTAKSKIEGFQWSINGGFGLGYKLHKQIGLYFEPKFSHFFKNNQPVSIRTDHPFVFGLNIGLRIGI